ncbi:Smr/MutS family protein [Terricaulis sp.]|uniref:Smr/MutS family protein n=1 Tax=Terricaulis sp. TaxID=2768686 RepID=UPI0037834F3E
MASTVKPRRPQTEHDHEREERPVRPHAGDRLHAPAALAAPAAKRTHSRSAPPADRGAEKRVRRGKLEIGAALDLHGYHQDSGFSAVVRFLHAAHARGDRTVIVVTGVGRGGHGVLRERLPHWLAEADVKTIVSGFAQAHRAHGGAGAYYVFLKVKRQH